jgi:hypothetical protein
MTSSQPTKDKKMSSVHETIESLLADAGYYQMYEGRYVVVKPIGKGLDREWYVIVADELDDAIDYEGPEDDCAIWSATPYLTRSEALGEAYGLLKN